MDDFHFLPPPHDANEGAGSGHYMDSGTEFRCHRVADGHTYISTVVATFCGCYRQSEICGGRYPGRLILPELNTMERICPIMV